MTRLVELEDHGLLVRAAPHTCCSWPPPRRSPRVVAIRTPAGADLRVVRQGRTVVVCVDRIPLGAAAGADDAQRVSVRAVTLHAAQRARQAGYRGPSFIGDCSTWWSVRAPAGDEPLLLTALLGIEAGMTDLADVYLSLGAHGRAVA